MEWTFGNLLWSMMLFFLWFAFLWMFIGVFLIATPRATAEERWPQARPRDARDGAAGRSTADEIAKAALLHDDGKITADEFELLKQRAPSH